MSMTQEELDALLAAPALAPPEGEIPNFDNPPNRNGLAWGVTTLCIVITTLCLLLRAYVRVWREKRIHKEEVLMILAYGALWGTAYAAYGMIYAPGYYVHQWHLTNGDLVRPLWLILVYGCCYSVVLPLIKTAILLDWCRVFISIDKYKSPFWWSCIILSVFQCLWGLACVILLNLQCRPHRAIWEFYIPAQCYALPSVMLGSGSVQVATDVLMVLLPQRIIWKLQMNWQRKLGISVIFGVGLIASVAACVRLAHTVTFAHEPDKMYFIGPLLFWAWGEMAAGFFILSVPCLPKLAAASSLPSKVRSLLGLSYGSKSISARNSNPLVTIGGTGGSNKKHHLVKSTLGTDTYHEIEDGVALGSESQEHLRQEQEHGSGLHPAREDERAIHVTHSTRVIVTKKDSGSDLSENLTPWTR